jgi:hypothetical protein
MDQGNAVLCHFIRHVTYCREIPLTSGLVRERFGSTENA